jgi:HK97 family phage major capsid protein
MSDKIIEKLDAIEASNESKIQEVKTEAVSAIEAAKAEMNEKLATIEARVSEIHAAPSIIKPSKSIKEDVNKMVREQLKKFAKKGTMEKELKMFEDESQYQAYLTESSSLTGGGYNIGGRTAYDPVFHTLRLINPMRGLSRNVTTDGSTYQFRAKTGNAGAAWGYAIQNNGTATTESTNIWQLVLQDLNVQFPIRTAALDDIDGLEANVVDDMLMEFSQQEGLSMIQNNDQGATTLPYGGSNGLRGLNQYANYGANASYAGGTISVGGFGTSGTASTNGLNQLAVYDQLTTNGNVVGAANVTYDDIINFIYSLPQQYWTPTAKFMVNPIFLAQIRGLKDSNGTPIFERMHPMDNDGIVGRMLGFDVVVNKYCDNPSEFTGNTSANLFPMYFGDFQRGHTIVDRLNMVLRRYDQTLPGYITFFGEKRLATSNVDPLSIIAFRSTATATA